MTYKLVILVLCIFLLSSCGIFSVFTDPGGNKKYEIDVSEFKATHKATVQEEALFKEKYVPELYDSLVKMQRGNGGYYRSKTKQKIAITVDTLLDLQVNYVLSDADKNKTIYFITYLTASYVIPNDSIKGKMINQTLRTEAMYTSSEINSIKIVPVSSMGCSYGYDTLSSNDRIVEYSQNSIIQYVLVDYEYYTSKQKENPAFWDNITKASMENSVMPKAVVPR